MSPSAPVAAAAPRRGALRRRLAGLTLRARLIAGLLVLFTVAAVGVSLATAAALRPFLLDRLDQELAAASTTFSAHNAPFGPGPADGAAGCAYGPPDLREQASGTLGVCIQTGHVTAAGVVRTGSEGSYTAAPPLTAADVAVLTAVPAGRGPGEVGNYSVHLSALGNYRVVARSGADETVYLTGLPLSGVEATVRQLELIEAVVFGAALLIIGVVGTAWVRLSLRPLGRITATAAEVTELPLASGQVTLPHRVAEADPRTEVGQLGEAFNRMLGHVEDALGKREASEARLRQFVADASHELRTPLAGIRGYTEFALRRGSALDRDLRRALTRVDAESARMSRLVDDLLLLARLDAGRPLAHETVDLTRLAIDVTNDARVAGPRHRWVLDLPDEPLTVTGDQHRLHQVLANLLGNARTHTPAGTTVTVRLTPAGDGVELTVSDDGPGIPAGMQTAVWERFTRGDTARSRRAGSTGLGLSIVAAVVSAHHGEVSLTSRPGKTTFGVWLPCKGPERTKGGRDQRDTKG